jgi:hypothetical protein
MPDADDFDVEYFRNLLKGNLEKKEQQAPAEKPAAPANRKKRSAAAPPPAKGKGKSATGPKKPGKR